MEYTASHDFPVSLDIYWDTFLHDEAYHRAFYEHMRLEPVTIDVVEDSGCVHIHTELVAKRKLPGFLKRIIGASTRTHERSIYNKADRRMDVTVDLPVIGSRCTFNGAYTCEPLETGGFRRHWRCEVVARLPLVGKRIERYIIGEVADAMERGYAFTCEWFRERHPEALVPTAD